MFRWLYLCSNFVVFYCYWCTRKPWSSSVYSVTTITISLHMIIILIIIHLSIYNIYDAVLSRLRTGEASLRRESETCGNKAATEAWTRNTKRNTGAWICMNGGYVVCLELWLYLCFILLLSSSITTGALGSPSLLLSCSIIPIALYITTTLTSRVSKRNEHTFVRYRPVVMSSSRSISGIYRSR